MAQVFSCEFSEISKKTFFTEHLWANAFTFTDFEASLDNCFSLCPVYVFKKRQFCAARKLSVFAKLEIGRKKTKIFQ